MADKFEQQFFRCFGIEKQEYKSCDVDTFCPYENMKCVDCAYYKTYKIDYPQISDKILLDLICILNSRISAYDAEYRWCRDRKNLKYVILKDCVYNKELIDKQVVKLFKEA